MDPNYLARLEQITEQQANQLSLALAALGNLPNAPQEKAKQVRLKDPAFFTGNPAELRTFVSGLQLKFYAEAISFDTEAKKVSYACSLLRDGAAQVLEPYLNNFAQYMDSISSFEDFAKLLQTSFGDPDEKKTFERDLYRLFQNSDPVTVYTAQFLRLSAPLGWNNEALESRYLYGLSKRVKDELTRRAPPRGRAELMQMASKINARFRARDLERKDSHRAEPFGPRRNPTVPSTQREVVAGNPRPSTSVNNRTIPMDLDGTKRGPLSDAEKKRRYNNNLCLYCGQAGHQIDECKLRNRKNQGN
ncbi:protein of unknown function [Taphrina deformans PYCC 5710]|uniref:CCHC-type domain-containing protein n=1 Tax=Taphrina deformans (strain PYCC 5710 / ATCC 11124 / CBS 356.35 / IMI 108563 / JCM 9778 / NBRC 8474) TaxID=1097556 RepID=R4XP08_TAPDE|nr:protein of unknown function [Taphrina deformans PYCC 5710]|eukprot:CCG84995.1 protein of unknown function [Taphrina deformans PYCC 5710]